MINQKPLSGELIDYGHPLSQGLIACWFMSEGSGNQIADLSGNGHYGVLTNDAFWVNYGKYGQCIELEGDTDYIDIIGSATNGGNPINLNDDCTILFWIYFHTSQSCYLINNYSDSINSSHINIHADPSGADLQVKAHFDDDANPTSLNGPIVPINTLAHIACVRKKGETITFYLNGVYYSSTTDVTTGSVLSDRNWRIGCKSMTTTEEEVDGAVDLPILYNRALSASEIALLYYYPFSIIGRKRRIIYDEIAAAGLGIPIVAHHRKLLEAA